MDSAQPPSAAAREPSRTAPPRPPLSPGHLSLLLLLCTLLAGASLWLTADMTRQRALADLAAHGEQALALFTANLESEVEKYAFLPHVLATDAAVVRGLKAGLGSPAAQRANRLLADVNRIAKTSDTYLMRPDGTTVAASNHDRPHSFVGSNFSFRPYFRRAMQGGQGRYFALGTTSNKRGYYFSAPVYDDEDDSIIGVAVVKVSMDRLEAAWRDSQVLMLLTDAHGVIFSASREGWQFRTLAPLPGALRQLLVASRQYRDQPLRPLPVLDRLPLHGRASLRIAAPGAAAAASAEGGADDRQRSAARRYLVQRSELPRSEWIALALSDTAPVQQRVGQALLFNALAIVLLLSLFGFWLNWRRGQHQRAALRERTERVLRKVRDRLEARVRLRTRELSESNAQLQCEIDQHRRTTAELKLAQVELVQAGKLAALGQLAAGITHEINQPLTAIRTYADNARALLDRGRAAEAADNLADISELTERMAQISDHLKIYARKSDGRLSRVPLGEIAERALALLHTKARRLGVAVELRIDPALCVWADEVRLEQVLLNLCNNALDAMALDAAADGAVRRLEIAAAPAPADGGAEPAAQIAITVRDTGPGIAAEHFDKLFDPFFTTKGVGEGLGLGLSISFSIVKQLGGQLAAANHPDGGACFTLRLRRCAAAAAVVATAVAQSPA